MKKFTKHPVALLEHYEQEGIVAYFWNKCIDEGLNPSEFQKAHKNLAAHFRKVNYETGISLINSGYVEEKQSKFKLTDKCIKRILKYQLLCSQNKKKKS